MQEGGASEKSSESKGRRASPEKAKDTDAKTELSTPVSSSKRKRKAPAAAATPSAAEVEQRTPLKRQRVPVQKFQSPAEEIIPVPSTSKQKDQAELLHKKGCFLGVRGEEGSFYLCKTIQNVFGNTRKFKIQWLDLAEPPDVYKLDFADTTDADCILTNVKMDRVARDTYRLPIKEQTRVEEILHRALKKERGEPIEELILIPSESEDDEEDADWGEQSPKKSKAKKSVSTPKEKKGKQTKPEKGKKNSPQKKEKTEKKKGPDRNLHPNPKIKVLDKEPFFETREKNEFVSKSNQGKLAIRAVLLNDKKLLKSLIEDKECVYKLDEMRSVEVSKNALHYAIEKGDHEAMKMLIKDFFGKENERIKNGTPQSVLIQSSDKGTYNPRSLGGLGAIRAISQSRGSKQGNDAFIMDQNQDPHDLEDYMEDALKLGVSKETLKVLANALPDHSSDCMMQRSISNLYQAVLCGNRKLAGYLVEEGLKDSFSGFGYLHKDVLLFDKEELRQTILAASVKKKPWDNKSITPLHCAAINPNVAYLKRLLTVEPNINLEDREHRRPIHFAAVCEGVGPLEFLLERGASPLEVDTRGMTPLHYACSAGRPRNVDILLKKAKDAAVKQGDMGHQKWGPGGVDRPSRSSYCPVHIAVSYNHADVLKILIKHQVDVNKVLSAGKNKITPLMIAAGHGDMEICKVLVQNGAHIEQLDKLKRSALIHAVLNGNTHIASYLLHLGADQNRCDSSGNSVIHYAAAYGWLFCLKLLKEAGADLGMSNQWKTTPIGIAFLKGHIGIVDYLIKQKDVDVNFKNDEGLTLLSVATSSALTPGLYDQIRYLTDKKADPTLRDANGLDALHHLARNNVAKTQTYHRWGWQQQQKKREIDEDKMNLTVKIAKLLLEAGCDPTSETEDGKTALMFAIEQLNIKLVELLVEAGGTVTSHKSDSGETILHLMADLCMESDLSGILKILVEQNPKLQEAVKAQRSAKNKVVIENGDIVDDDKSEPMEVVADKSEKQKSDTPKENGSGDAKTDAVNGMEVDDVTIPKLEKMSSIASQEDIWPIMATELNHEGYTPLLWACKVYKDYKKSGAMTDDDVKKSSENGRNFIQALIELTGADVSATVQEKHFPAENPVVVNEEERYTMDGKSSALHMLLHVGHEVVEGLNCAGLELVCRYKPNTEHRNLANQTALALAVESKSQQALGILIKAGADVNPVYGTEVTGKFTPLHKAADLSSAKIVKMLIEAGADVKRANTKTGEQPLNLAVHFRGDEAVVIEIAKVLLDAGAEVNAGKQTALHTAVLANLGTSNASTELEEFLISRGANVFAKDEKNRIPLHYAFISKNKPDSVSALDPIELCSVLTDAMQNKELDARDENGRSPLHLAAMRGATICCIHLLQRGVPILGTDTYGHTALSLAVKYKHDSCAIMLLQKGAKVDATITIPVENKDQREYHTSSITSRKVPVWKWKRSRYAEKVTKPEHFDTYQVAIEGELQGVAHMVLDSSGFTGKAIEAALKVNKYHIALRHLHRIKDAAIIRDYKNKDGQNLLHILALETRPGKDKALQLKVAKGLVEKGVSLTDVDKYKRYPLVYVALRHQPIDLAKFFLESSKGLDLNQKDIYDRTAMVALFWDQQEIHKEEKSDRKSYIKLLLDAGASLDVAYAVQWPETPLFDVAIADLPLDYFEPLEHPGRLTPLMSALYNNDLELVRFLLKNGASSNLPDQNGVTPVMHAAKLHDAKLVKILLDNDYVIKAEKDGSKTSLKKKLSRALFEIKPVGGDDDDNEDDNEDDGDDDDNENYDEDNDDNEGGDGSDEGNDEDQEPEEEEPAEDSDHDTDVVEDEEDEDGNDADSQHLPIPRLGSKQPSMRKQATSLQSDKDDFEVVVKTSSVDLTVKDKFGWTVIHHLVSPLDYGTFDDEEILFVLAKAGAPLDTENKQGETPLKMALRIGSQKVATRLQALLNVEEDKQEKPAQPPFHAPTEADNNLATAEANMYEADADSMMKKLLPSDAEESKTKRKPKVDKQCMAADTGEVVFDKVNKMAYDIILSKIEVRSLLSDTYNFYKMQIIYHKVKAIYILFTKWGRIGDTGMYQQTPYQTLTEAAVSFCKIFKSKTGNAWSDIKSFVNQPKKYRLVQLDSQPAPLLRVDFKLESSIPSKLPVDVQDLLKEMADVGMMQAAMKNAKVAEEYMPFGRIKRDVLVEARKLLQKIGDIVVDIEKNKTNLAFDQSEHQANCEKISALSTEYYSLIPQEGYSYDKVEPLVNRSHITAEMRLISNLLDLETASKILLGAQYKLNECNPLDYMYQAIGCSITPLREDDVESQYILKYIRSSTDFNSSKVLCIYKLWRPGEDQKEKFKKLDNHKMLWHGSNVANFMSILHNGLLVAPPEAPITGHAFGEGIYSADTFAKSNMYCRNTNPKSNVKCALLCEVALGNCKEDVDQGVEVDLINSEFNSLKIHGTNVPDEHWNLTLPYGAVMPMGCTQKQHKFISPQGEKRRWIPYTEYIVQDSDQICLRYLVQFV
ncbi:poly [ADP-ribose] polymerase tankyrase-like [Mercenaria mercenaria]|uniref:poly [ADP-ribose] polymerase tankyrase-like n=1 Tax=Mercenaria mercenaria TaxID=6596 RepID=UPI00234F2D8A|nr:poly [ADP-ribose] polymerase tankyrase-like [Mercenaria mercenaria]